MMAASETPQETSKETSGGGILGAAGAMMEKVGLKGSSAEMASRLTRLGLPGDQLPQFVSTVLDFLKKKLPADTAKQVSALLPVGESSS
jgi:hypothetical protein